MTRLKLFATVAILALTPAAAFAQSALSDPAVPGSGYRILSVPRTSQQPLAAYQAGTGGSGDGYGIAAAPQSRARGLAANVADPGIPGDGYRIR